MAKIRRVLQVFPVLKGSVYEVGKDGVEEIDYANSHWQVYLKNGNAMLLPFLAYGALLGPEEEDPNIKSFEDQLKDALFELSPTSEEVTS